MDHLRRQQTVYIEDFVTVEGVNCIATDGRVRSSPLKEALRGERARANEFAIELLPAIQGMVVRLKFQRDMSLKRSLLCSKFL